MRIERELRYKRNMIRQFQIFLGVQRLRALFILLALTGFANLVFYAADEDWSADAQTLSVLVFVVGLVIIIGGRLEPYERGRWASIMVPAFILVIFAVVIPELSLAFFGGAFGWMIAAMFLFRTRGAMEYRQAVKHLRKDEYDSAVEQMSDLIKQEPDVAQHYRFRAEILRLWGKLDRARRDYEKMTQIDPESAVAYNGLAEVNLQAKRYDEAHIAAQRAFELAPNEWVASYNLGMIEDRLQQSEDAIEHLNHALNSKVKDARHRLLIHVYLARAYSRLGNLEDANTQVEHLKRLPNGLSEWQTIMDSPQAGTLRAVIADDIKLAEQLINDDITVADIA